MPKLNTLFRLVLIVLLGSVGLSAYADFNKGQAAYDRGDYATALREWKPLAEQGHAEAQFSLGRMYANGQGVPQDDKAAAQWYTRAAEQGNADAQLNLAWMYQNGRGVPRDDKAAAQWYRLAAEQWNARAQAGGPGWMYRKGKGVPQDDKVAAQWYRFVAEQGYAPAQKGLAEMYLRGTGVPQDIILAYMWANIAVFGGEKDAREVRNLAEETMTPSQIAEAQKRARECIRRQYKGC